MTQILAAVDSRPHDQGSSGGRYLGGTFQTKRAAFFTLKKSQQTGWPAVAARSRQPAEMSRQLAEMSGQLAEMSGQLAEMSWQAAGRKSEIRLFPEMRELSQIRKKSDFRLSAGSFLAGCQDISASCRDISAGCRDLVASSQGVPGRFAPQ